MLHIIFVAELSVPLEEMLGNMQIYKARPVLFDIGCSICGMLSIVPLFLVARSLLAVHTPGSVEV